MNNNEKIAISVFVLISLIALSFFIFNYYSSPARLDSSKLHEMIISNPDLYATPSFFNSLTGEQKENVAKNLDGELYTRCIKPDAEPGICTKYTVWLFIKVKSLLDIPIVSNQEQADFLESFYQETKSSSPNLTESNFNEFIVPYLVEICTNNMLNETEKEYWKETLLKVRTNNIDASHAKMYYLISCMNMTSIEKIPLYVDSMCSFLPSVEGASNACVMADRIAIRRFCNQTFTSEEVSQASVFMNMQYTDEFNNNCKHRLINAMTRNYS